MRSVCILSCFRLCDPMDCSSPGSSVHGILQARILVWVVMPSSRDLLNWGIKPASPASPALQVDSLPIEPIGKPQKWGDIRSNHSLSRWQFIQYFLSLTLHLSKGFNNTCCVSPAAFLGLASSTQIWSRLNKQVMLYQWLPGSSLSRIQGVPSGWTASARDRETSLDRAKSARERERKREREREWPDGGVCRVWQSLAESGNALFFTIAFIP